MGEVKICKNLEEESSCFDTSLKFKAELLPQTSFMNSKYFQIDSTMVSQLDRVAEIYKHELIYNGKYLLVFAKIFNSVKKHLLIYKPPEDGSKVLKACKEFEIPMDCQLYFLLHSGSTIVFIGYSYSEDETWFYQINLDLSLNIEFFKVKLHTSRVSESSYNELRYSQCYEISGDLLAIGFIGIDYEYEMECDFVKVFDCSSQITEVLSINVRKFTEYNVNNFCFLDNNKKLAIITSHLEYIIVDIQSGVGEVKEINSLSTFHKDYIHPLMFVSIQYESTIEIVLIITDDGFILKINKEKSFLLVDKIQENFHDNSIISSYLCVFNKWIYFFCANFVIYVYDPFHEVVVHEFDTIRHNLDTEIIVDWLNTKICIDWFGDQLFYNTKDKIIIEQIFRHKCFSLRYIARKALFKYHSENKLKELKLGKKINQLIFDNIY